jgi:hypothetical protein
MHDRAYLATRSAELAAAVYLQDRYDEADRWSRYAERYGASDDIPTQFLWRAVRAKLLARGGAFAEAEVLARQAVRLSESTDAINRQAQILLDLGEVLGLSDHDLEAADAIREALGLFDQKGNLVEAKRARTLLAEFAVA